MLGSRWGEGAIGIIRSSIHGPRILGAKEATAERFWEDYERIRE